MTKTFHPNKHKPAITFPAVFHDIVRVRDEVLGSVLKASFTPWRHKSLKRRFELFMQTLKHDSKEPLHMNAALFYWCFVEVKLDDGPAWIITAKRKVLTKKN